MDIHITHGRSRMSENLLHTFFKVETTHWWWVARKKIVTNLLRKYLDKKNNLILDAGCGTGAEILYLSEFGKVYGVDISYQAVKFCKKRGIKNIRTGNILNLPYENNFFDLVCLMDVIEHVSNDKLAIKEARRVLKPGGILLITLPALPFIYSRHDREQGHFRRYSKKDLENILKNNGLTKRRLSYFNALLSFPIILVRLLSRVGGPLSKLADFDSKINYDISKKRKINYALTEIFSFESKLLKFSDLPFGVSLLALYQK